MNQICLKENKSIFSIKNKIARIVWGAVYLLFFKTSPKLLFNKYRLFLLRLFGAHIGNGSIVYPSAKIWAPWNLTVGEYSCIGPDADIYSMDKIVIGDNVTISQNSFLCTGSHDVGSKSMRLITKPIYIEDGVWVSSHAKILPGVTLKEGCVIGMASVVTKNTSSWTVYGGNPSVVIKKRVIENE